MRHEADSNLFIAEEGKTFARKYDGFVMGTIIDLGIDDSIYNYEEIGLTEENDVEGILKRKKEREERMGKREARR